MKFYRCECGKHEAIGSMPPNPCDGCEDCGTNLSTHPDFHQLPKPHEYVETEVETDEGKKTLTICRWCNKRKTD